MNLERKLPKDVKDRLAELEALSDKARDGDKEAMRELRQALRESSPEIVARASDFARTGQRVLAETIAAGEPLMEEALVARLELMRAEVAGENPTPLEVLLTERIVSAWLVVEVLQALMNAQLKRGESVPRAPTSYLKFIIGWLESANRRYLSSIRGLARVRKLQNNTPGVQFNTQINLATPGEGRSRIARGCGRSTTEQPRLLLRAGLGYAVGPRAAIMLRNRLLGAREGLHTSGSHEPLQQRS